MRRLNRLTIMITWAVLCIAAPAAAREPKDFILGRAIVLDNIQQPEDAPVFVVPCENTNPNVECLPWLVWWPVKIRVVQLYGGMLEHRSANAWIATHSMWLLRREGTPFLQLPRIYFVARIVDGEFRILSWEYADHGFCLVSDSDARVIGFEKKIEELKRDHPCR